MVRSYVRRTVHKPAKIGYPRDAFITPSGLLKTVEGSHPETLERIEGYEADVWEKVTEPESEGGGYVRIGGNFPTGEPSDYVFFEGHVDSLREHSNLIQDIVGRWAKDDAIIELSAHLGKRGGYNGEFTPQEIYETNVGDLVASRGEPIT